MLKIKKGSSINAFGHSANPFDEQSELSQEVLEYLQAKFPDDIEKITEVKKGTETKKK